MGEIRAKITGVGAYVPEYVLSNEELEKLVDTTDEWITSRTGITERRILKAPGEGVSYMGERAINELLRKTNTAPEEIDLIICATVTPDMIFPATANILSDKCGLKNAYGFDVEAACSGFLFSLNIATQYIKAGTSKKVIVIGTDKMSAIVDYTDRTTCVLFGDGAGAVLLEATTEDYGIMDQIMRSEGSGRHYLYQKAGGSCFPPSEETIRNREHFIFQEGKTVFKFAVKSMADVAFELMERNGLKADDIAYLVPHQANMRIITATADRMGISEDKVMINIHKFGNTTNATIPLCLNEWEDRLHKGDNIILAAFGGGFTWGSIYLKWAY
jgi:3-oxoacyl-[acyl-carrier-protein] synthase III